MVDYNLIYVHIGNKYPNYIFDSIYQNLLVSPSTKIYILINTVLIDDFRQKINKFNINLYTKNNLNFNLNIEYIPLEILNCEELNEYNIFTNNLNKETLEFRDSFWVTTTARFFYLYKFIDLFQLQNCIHIENDVMIYIDFKHLDLNSYFLNTENINKGICLLQDSSSRVIPSILFIKTPFYIKQLIDFILNEIKLTSFFLNDMDLLGKFSNSYKNYVLKFPFTFNCKFEKSDQNKTINYIFDGASIGQFLGGVDPRNLEKDLLKNKLIIFNNPSKNFINETSLFKPNELGLTIFRKNIVNDHLLIPLNLVFTTKELANSIIFKQIVNLHIHSKQLYQFSSVFNINYPDIITGDRICSLCDFVLTTNDIYNYHKHLHNFINPDNIIIINDFSSINIQSLNSIFHEFIIKTGKKHVKLFLYTHMLNSFTKHILSKLSSKLKYHIYLHNSDKCLDDSNYNLLNDSKNITKVFSQNINCPLNTKFNILPIGLENSMWNNTNILTIYEIMSKQYLLSKTKNLYVNINTNTFPYRLTLLNQFKLTFNITNVRKPFNQYLEELSTHRFCLAVRGNGICTHRLWESLYLGVIPVFINNKFTNMNNWVQYFKKLNLPFYEITEEHFTKYSDDFFNERLYKKIIKNSGQSIYNLNALKLSNYS